MHFNKEYTLKLFFERKRAQVGWGAQGEADAPLIREPNVGPIPELRDHDLS